MAKCTVDGHGLQPAERECLEQEINSRMTRCDNSKCKHIAAVHGMDSGDSYCKIPGCNCVNGKPE